jgi:hypothetical protein
MVHRLVIVLALVHTLANAQSFQRIQLKNCVELCLVFYADQSGSMDEAHNDICRWARSMSLVPTNDGSASVGLYSFELQYTQWLLPTSDKQSLVVATDSMCGKKQNNGTIMSGGLIAIAELLAERRTEHPFEHQVVLVHSDFFIDNEDHATTNSVLAELVETGVLVLLSVPQVYDTDAPSLSRIPETNVYNPNLSEIYITELQELGAISIRSSYEKFASLLGALTPKRGCN